jgi:hypothetical protein
MRLARAATDSFEGHAFPTTTADLIDAHGDVEIELPNGAVTLGEVLGRLPNETLETAEQARLTTYSALGEAAIGRKGYSDRDPSCLGVAGHERVSF